MLVHETIIQGAIGVVFLVAVAADSGMFDQRLWEVCLLLIGLVTSMLGGMIRKLFVSKADRAEVLALSKSIEQLRSDKDRAHADIVTSLKDVLYRMHTENKEAIKMQAAAMAELNATMRLLMQQMLDRKNG